MNYQTMFLVFMNSFITVPRFAEFYSLSEQQAHKVINKGRAIHETNFGSIT